MRENYAQGIKRFFITGDNFARKRDWEKMVDRLIKLRVEEGLNIGFTIQVDTLCHRIPNFIEKTNRFHYRRAVKGGTPIIGDSSTIRAACGSRRAPAGQCRRSIGCWSSFSRCGSS